MHVSFFGAVREVTGSFHTLTTDHDTILFDCGLFQGKRKETEAKNRVLAVDPKSLSNIVLSHAHIDHSGRLPLVVKGGFTGQIFCSRATAAAGAYLLRDSAKIQEGDATYLNYKTAKAFLAKVRSSDGRIAISPEDLKEIKVMLKTGDHGLRSEVIEKLLRQHHLEIVTPLYSMEEVESTLASFQGIPYGETVTIGNNLDCTFYEAGHILGSALSVVRWRGNGQARTVLYSGDVGRFGKPILKDPNLLFPEEHREIDLLILESTYGNRLHGPMSDMKPLLKKVLCQTFDRGGSVIIPAFAYGRTQELIYFLHELYLAGEVPPMPVWVDSPLATQITHVFGEHPETYDQETHEIFLRRGLNPFDFSQLKFIQGVEESMALNRDHRSHVVLAGSGMCEGGRILHHLRHKIHDERNTVLIVGYMGLNTFGRRLQEVGEKYAAEGRIGPPPLVRFFDKDYPLRAEVVTLGGFSAHADRDELLRFLRESNLTIKRIALVHGEEDQTLAFAESLRAAGYQVTVPWHGQSIVV